ncbi:hypothetical protein Cni_G18658 [Canna indica]|uniref:C2H2-type domain-containing protein n=1 Tax=Canna indica TaxID=4628 RepID=A0AAQ3KL40_9LILI|nr:hypothetical protein Cni_G18658 [Canna indica]
MQTPDEALGYSNSSDSISGGEFVHPVVKGKRTKRQRTQPPPLLSVAVADSSSASSAAEAFSGTVTEEEEDMANCLILLAQGRALDGGAPKPDELYKEETTGGGGGRPEKFTSRRFAEAATTANGGKAGVYVYECKTCSKCFPSFQALGGHRTSHKKPRLTAANAAEEKKLALGDDVLQMSVNSVSKAVANGSHANAKPKVHECSICGSEFSSGQALGGHMRRHRPLAVAESHEAKKEKSFLSLDLNLPAPADDELQRPSSPSTFSLASKRPPLMFSASASALVVDCHY